MRRESESVSQSVLSSDDSVVTIIRKLLIIEDHGRDIEVCPLRSRAEGSIAANRSKQDSRKIARLT